MRLRERNPFLCFVAIRRVLRWYLSTAMTIYMYLRDRRGHYAYRYRAILANVSLYVRDWKGSTSLIMLGTGSDWIRPCFRNSAPSSMLMSCQLWTRLHIASILSGTYTAINSCSHEGRIVTCRSGISPVLDSTWQWMIDYKCASLVVDSTLGQFG